MRKDITEEREDDFGSEYLSKSVLQKSAISCIKNVTNELSPLLSPEILLKRHISWRNEALMEVMGATDTAHSSHANTVWEVVGYLGEILKSPAMSGRHLS